MLNRAGLAVFSISFFLSGCGGSGSSGDDSVSVQRAAVISTVSSGFDASEIAIVDMSYEDYQVDGTVYPGAESDISIASNGADFYRLGRLNIDVLTKYSTDSGNTAQAWEYSTLEDGESTSNPQSLAFASDTKAYLTRLGSSTVWIVNPEATSEDEFKIGELDLSAYADDDGLPEAAGAIVIGDRLFLILQRLDRDNFFAPTNTAYVAVFDTETDTEIDTGQDAGVLNGIPLLTRNPQRFVYHEGAGLFVQSIGAYSGSFTGGVERIDLTTYTVSYLLDDGDNADHPYDRISGFTVIDEDNAFFVSYSGWQDTALYWIDPETGEVSADVVASLDGVDIRDVVRGPEGNLWVAIADLANPGVVVLDPQTDEVLDEIQTNLNPTKIEFTEY